MVVVPSARFDRQILSACNDKNCQFQVLLPDAYF